MFTAPPTLEWAVYTFALARGWTSAAGLPLQITHKQGNRSTCCGVEADLRLKKSPPTPTELEITRRIYRSLLQSLPALRSSKRARRKPGGRYQSHHCKLECDVYESAPWIANELLTAVEELRRSSSGNVWIFGIFSGNSKSLFPRVFPPLLAARAAQRPAARLRLMAMTKVAFLYHQRGIGGPFSIDDHTFTSPPPQNGIVNPATGKIAGE